MRFLLCALLCAFLALSAGCCSADPAPATPGAAGVELEPVVAQPVRGICTPTIFGCKICVGVDCAPDPVFESVVMGTPVARPAAPAAAPDPCAPVYESPCVEYAAPAPAAAPCGSASEPYCPECDAFASGSASDGDYGTPPALMVR